MFGPATLSVCPVCLGVIPAERCAEGDRVYLVKSCPEHGEFRALVWRGEPGLAEWWHPRRPSGAGAYAPETPRGCPYDCGICAEHEQHSCTVLFEVTQRCNLACPYCFADSGAGAAGDPSLETVAGWFEDAIGQCGPRANVQLSGGEPTVRDDLPAIVALCRSAGFGFVQLNTNGLRLAEEPGYAAELRRAGLASVFLQFDGTRDAIYRTLRGRPLLAEKLLAVERCTAAGLGVVLVPTLVPGVNTGDAGAIVRQALALAPGVRGVHFQPVSYFGRYPGAPGDADRLALPDLMRALEEQTGGLMRASDFEPPGCEHPYCSFHGNYLRTAAGGLEPLGGSCAACCAEAPEDGAGRAVAFVARQWSGRERGAGAAAEPDVAPLLAAPQPDADSHPDACCCAPDPFGEFVASHRENTFAVSAMAFQDAWNLDLERLRGCCIHVYAADGRLVPFCAYNLTSASGRSLYRGPRC